MNALLSAPLFVPLAMAVVALVGRRHRWLQRAAGFVGAITLTAVGATLTAYTSTSGPVATQVGGFRAAVAINLAADVFSSLMLAAAGTLLVVCLAFAVWSGADRRSPTFHAATQTLTAGVAMSFLTADLFNLFVAFEVLLISSYVLVGLGGPRERATAFRYAAVNLLASTILLAGVGLVYAGAGTVNLAALAGIEVSGAMLVGAVLAMIAFTVKAGLVPVHGWLPTTYPSTHPAVAAMFSGLLTKVGTYALYRVVTLVLPGDDRFGAALAVLAGASMLIGVLGAIGQTTLRGILSFHITSQVGYIVMGLAVGGRIGLAAGIAYTIHHMFAKTSLFLTAGAVESAFGTGRLDRLGGIARTWPGLASVFGIAAVGLAGLPPLSGFVPKFGLLVGAFTAGQWALGALSVVVTVLTLASMVKIWTGAFWGPATTDVPPAPEPAHDRTLVAVPAGAADARPTEYRAPLAVDRARRRRLLAPATAVAAVGAALAIGLGAGPLFHVAGIAADQLLDPTTYVQAVLEEEAP